jgi:dihydropteroate synthase
MQRIDVSPEGIDLMAGKFAVRAVKVHDVSYPVANILKQEMLSLSADAAVGWGVLTGKQKTSDIILMGTDKQLDRLSEKLRSQQFFKLPLLADELDRLMKQEGPRVLRGRNFELAVGDRTHVMGILNVTPDSFTDGGKYLERDRAIERALEMVEEGADIIDVGGESSRPGSDPVPEEEELARVIPVIENISDKLDVPISVDTRRHLVAREAIQTGARMINDITGLRGDPEMAGVVAESGCAVVIMHMKGQPKDMQENPTYEDLMGEIYDYLQEGVETARAEGIELDRIVIDPGIGFGKTMEHNLEILRRFSEFAGIGVTMLSGPSRKRFIGTILDLPEYDRVQGTLAAVAASVYGGAHIVRVHDVRPAVRLTRMLDAILRTK